MTNLQTAEIATAFGGVDDDAFADGAPVSALVLRTMATQANRIMTRGHPLFWRCWSPRPSVAEWGGRGDARMAVPPIWTPITRRVRLPKMPGPSTISYALVHRFPNEGDVVRIAVVTNGRRIAESTPYLDITAPATPTATLASVDVAATSLALEEAQVWIAGVPSTRAMSSSYGTPSTGTVSGWQFNYQLVSSTGTSWNPSSGLTGNSPGENNTVLEFLDSDSNRITAPRVVWNNGTNWANVYPTIDTEEARRLEGTTWRLVESPRFTMLCDAMVLKHRTN